MRTHFCDKNPESRSFREKTDEKKQSKRQRINGKAYSDLGTLEYLHESLQNPSIRTRVLNILLWHGKHADSCKFRYYLFQIISMVLSASITLINIVSITGREQIISTCSVLLTFITGLTMMMKYQENWLRYRQYYEEVKSQCFLYLTHSGAYKNLGEEERDSAFCEYLENHAIQINDEWASSEKGDAQ